MKDFITTFQDTATPCEGLKHSFSWRLTASRTDLLTRAVRKKDRKEALRRPPTCFAWELLLGWGTAFGVHMSYLAATWQSRLHLTICQINLDLGSQTWLSGLTRLIMMDFSGNPWAVDDHVITWSQSWPAGSTSRLLNSDAAACLAVTFGSWFLLPLGVRKGLSELPSYKMMIL